MPLIEQVGSPRRRRGALLENALLDAAWDELADNGYDGFTIEGVAERAATSRAVIYRRWPTKADLVRATVVRAADREPLEVPDTGTLREDMVELLRRANRSRAGIGIVVAVQLAGYYAETGTGLADLRSELLVAGRRNVVDVVISRAVARGEIDPSRLNPRVVSAPFDLYRHELLMTLKPVPDDVIESIIDKIFLPLVTRPSAAR